VRVVLLPTIVICLAASANADDSAVRTITEAELVAKLAGDPRVARIAADVDDARADVAAARVHPNPSIAYDREEVFPDSGLATSYLRLTLPLQISGRRSALTSAAKAKVDAAASEADGARFTLVMQGIRAFRLAAYERTRSELLRTERAALLMAVEVVRKRSTAGTASGYDVQRIELELARYDDQIAAAQTQLMTARLELGVLAGIPDGVDAAGALDMPRDPPALDALLQNALAGRADYRAASARLEASQRLARAARRSWIPDLALTAGLMTQELDPTTTARGYTAGVSLSLPLFDHGQADRARAVAQKHAADADRAVLARTVPATVRTRYLTLVQTLDRARTIARDQVARLEQLLRSAETAYRDGGGNIVELLDAYTSARDVRLRDLELRRDASLAEIELWLALGRRP
jgi:cobalt-zinc-cadmium efflux system outer membrane protein